MPHKLTDGHVTYGEIISRHLLHLYGKLEGKTLEETMTISESIDPLRAETGASAEAKQYIDKLNAWHLELSMTNDLIDHILDSVEGPEWASSATYVAQGKMKELIETCPFPDMERPNTRA